MTYIEMLNKFNEEFPDAEVSDYRPSYDEFVKNKTGIILWLTNGDTIVYFPKDE